MSEIVRETSEYVEMSDSITLCIVKDGAAGTSLNMKTGISSTDGLPSSGASAGDSYIIDGHLWSYTGTTVSDSTHRNGFTDCGKVSGEAGKNNYVHVAWSNKQSPKKEEDVVLSNTDGGAYAYMGTWVSETKEDTADEAVNMAKWVYVKGDKGDTPEIAKLRVNHSVCHFSRTSNTWDFDNVTVSIVVMNGGETEIPAYGDTTKYFWRLSTDDTSTKRSSGMGFSASLTASSITVNLYKTGSDENVAIDTITVPMVFDGKDGNGTPGVSYRLVPMSDRSATVKASNSSTNATFALHYTLHYKAVKMVGDSSESATIATIAATIEDKTVITTVNNTEGTLSGTGTESYTSDNRPADSIPVKVTLSDGTVLYDNVPVTMEAGVAVDINEKLGKITTTLTDPNGDFNTIKNTANSNSARISTLDGRVTTVEQTANNISLKVQEIGRKSRNLVSGGNVTGLYSKKYNVFVSSSFVMEQGKTYTVTARLWLESASNGHFVRIYAFGADNSWDPAPYSPIGFTNTSSSVVRFKFEAPVTKQMVIGIYEMDSSGGSPVDGNYNGVHIDWVRVDEGDWTGTGDNGKTLEAWTPAEEEIDALNLLPDPDFSEPILYSDVMGERKCFDRLSGGNVSGMSKDDSTVDGCYGIKIEQKNGTGENYDVLQYVVPFRGAGTYRLSCFVKDLHQTDASRPSWSSGSDGALYMECHPMDANKTRITEAVFTYALFNGQRYGDERFTTSHNFGDTAVRKNTSTEVSIAYLEVRIYLLKNGSVRVSRLCLSKSAHFTYWNANEVSEARKKDAAQLATGIDIYSHKIIATADNFVVRNNSGETTSALDADGNLKAGSLTCQDKETGVILKMMHGFFTALKGKAGVGLGLDENNYPCLYGTDPDGKVLWRLGQTYETADQDSKVTMEVVSMKAYGQMNSYAIGEGVILTLNVTNNTNAAITINTSNMHMVLKSEFGTYRGNVDVVTNISVGATAQVVLRGTEAIDTSSSSSTYTSPVGRSVTAVVVYQGDMRLTQDAEYQYQEGLRKDSDGNVQYTLPLM